LKESESNYQIPRLFYIWFPCLIAGVILVTVGLGSLFIPRGPYCFDTITAKSSYRTLRIMSRSIQLLYLFRNPFSDIGHFARVLLAYETGLNFGLCWISVGHVINANFVTSVSDSIVLYIILSVSGIFVFGIIYMIFVGLIKEKIRTITANTDRFSRTILEKITSLKNVKFIRLVLLNIICIGVDGYVFWRYSTTRLMPIGQNFACYVCIDILLDILVGYLHCKYPGLALWSYLPIKDIEQKERKEDKKRRNAYKDSRDTK